MTYSRDNPSPDYRELLNIYAEAHVEGLAEKKGETLFDGSSLYPHIGEIRHLALDTGATSVLDFGSGKGRLYEAGPFDLVDGNRISAIADHWQVDEIVCYDPGVEKFSSYPDRVFDGVICTDVLEHIPQDDVDWFLAELFALAGRFLFANIASYPAVKTLPNGWNAHVTVKPHDWWRTRIRKAADGWSGKRYSFQVTERKRGLSRMLHSFTGTSKFAAHAIDGPLHELSETT